MFVYLDAFLLFSFVLMNIWHFLWTFLCLILIVLIKHFKGHMKILASALYHKGHYPQSHYQHSMVMAYTCKNFIFLLQHFFFVKNKTPILDAPQYYFLCLVIWHQYPFFTITHFSTTSYPSIQRRPLVFKTNGCLNFQKHLSISILEKIATRNIFGNFLVKHPYGSSF